MVFTLYKKWTDQQSKQRLKKFYEQQEQLVNGVQSDHSLIQMEEKDKAVQDEEDEMERREKLWDTRLSMVVIALNVFLVLAKIFAFVITNSISILASITDSFMDITAGLIIWYVCRKMEKTEKTSYPVGAERMETLMTLMVGMIMIFANLCVVFESLIRIISNSVHVDFEYVSIGILVTGTCIKFVLFLICRRRKSQSSKCLAIDQRNDCITNIAAILGAVMGAELWKYVDPIMAFFVSGFIIVTWTITVRQQLPYLIGRSAGKEFINRIAAVSVNHDVRIKSIDTIHVYHFGENFLVEVHVVMDHDCLLTESHDVSEGLQKKLELLPYVHRAFVHCDYMLDGDEHI